MLFAFLAIFLILFSQFPLAGRLPGNTDSLLAMTLSNLFWEKIVLFLSGDLPYTALYPARDVMAYGENCYGLATLFLVFKLLTQSGIWAYYLFTVTIFSLNAFALTRLANLFVADIRIASLSGIAFSIAGFTLGNIDDPNVVFVFFPVMAIGFFFRWIRENELRFLKMALLFSSIQIWFGLYIFAFQFLTMMLFTLCYLGVIVRLLKWQHLRWFLLYYIAPAMPLLLIYLNNHSFAEIVSPYEVLKDCSLSWANFSGHLPGNLLYPDVSGHLGWVEIRKNCFPGVVLTVLSLLGAVQFLNRFRDGFKVKSRNPTFFFVLFSVFLFLSFGVNNPLFGLGPKIPFMAYIRVPSRFYLFSLIALSIYFSMGTERVLNAQFFRKRNATLSFVVLIGLIFAIENVPHPLFGYEYKSLVQPSKTYMDFSRLDSKRRVLLDLPSTIKFLPGQLVVTSNRLWFFNREIIYMNWQTFHHQIIAGGANGYVSKARADVESFTRRLPDRDALRGLQEIGVEYLIFHKDLVLFPEEDILAKLRASKELKLKLEGAREVIFEITI
jgi:hypothetical protein